MEIAYFSLECCFLMEGLSSAILQNSYKPDNLLHCFTTSACGKSKTNEEMFSKTT